MPISLHFSILLQYCQLFQSKIMHKLPFIDDGPVKKNFQIERIIGKDLIILFVVNNQKSVSEDCVSLIYILKGRCQLSSRHCYFRQKQVAPSTLWVQVNQLERLCLSQRCLGLFYFRTVEVYFANFVSHLKIIRMLFSEIVDYILSSFFETLFTLDPHLFTLIFVKFLCLWRCW